MKFLAYFDYLGFKDFIERNSVEVQNKVVDRNFRDIETSLSKGKFKEVSHGVIADLSDSTIDCINFSDTVIFSTQDDSLTSLKDLLDVADEYNWRCNDYFFPVRGAVVHGEVFSRNFQHVSKNGARYGINSVFGQALIDAHLKAEYQDWAGTVIDQSIIDFLKSQQIDSNNFLLPYAKKYLVPYKNNPQNQDLEWVFHLVKTHGEKLNDEAFKNMSRNIVENFENYNKRVESDSVQRKLNNTLGFLASYR